MAKVHIGGVLRCCFATIGKLTDKELDAMEAGAVIECEFCDNGLQKREDGDWELWIRPKSDLDVCDGGYMQP